MRPSSRDHITKEKKVARLKYAERQIEKWIKWSIENAMAKAKMNFVVFKKKPKIKRPGVHAKTKSSNSKSSKNYLKKYKGQGK